MQFSSQYYTSGNFDGKVETCTNSNCLEMDNQYKFEICDISISKF